MTTTLTGRPAKLRVHDSRKFRVLPVYVPAVGESRPGHRSEVRDEVSGEMIGTCTAGVIFLDGTPFIPGTAVDCDGLRRLTLVEFPDGPTAWVKDADVMISASVPVGRAS